MRTILGLVALHCAATLAADSVVLVNGDRLTGKVQRLQDGRLVLKTDLMGTVRVAWRNVRTLASDSRFEILTEAGDKYAGRLARDNAVTSVASGGQPAAELDSASVVRIAPEGPASGPGRILRAMSGEADIGYSVARGNQNQMQSSLGAEAAYRSLRYEFTGRLVSLFARQDGARSQSRHALNMRFDRFVSPRLFTYGLSAFERNERRSLDLRSRLGGGVGWRFRTQGPTRISGLGGFAFAHERIRGQPNQATGETFTGVEVNTRLFSRVVVSTEVTLHPDLVRRRRLRLEFDSTVRVPVWGRFTYSVHLFDRFNNRPAEGIERNDYGIVTGLGVSF